MQRNTQQLERSITPWSAVSAPCPVVEALPTALPEDKKKKYLTCTLPVLSMLPPLPYFEGLPVPPGFEVIER